MKDSIEGKCIKDTQEESEKKECFKLCPGGFDSCFNTACFYWYRFY